MSNTTGTIFRLTTFGESHGPAIGGVIDGVPAGHTVDTEAIQHELDRRRPGQSALTTQRNETDTVRFLSGIFEGRTTGTPIGFIIENADQHSSDYEAMRHIFRPSHADYTYTAKYGLRDHRGGGRSSARETACRVVAGALAAQILAHYGVRVTAFASAVGPVRMEIPAETPTRTDIESNPVRCPDPEKAEQMESLIRQVKADGDTTGGRVTCFIDGCPPGIGEPQFDKLQARLASAMMGINAAKAFEYGMGIDGCALRGSQTVDSFVPGPDGTVATATNRSGGIQGGISNGNRIVLSVWFKPVATLLMPVDTVDDNGVPVILKARGRHDPCVVPRAVPVVEAMSSITLLDLILLARTNRL